MNIICVNALNDNYIWVLYNNNNEAIAIDCGDFEPIKKVLEQLNLKLKYILITHHHFDHIDGIMDAKKYDNNIQIVGNKHFKDRLPKLDIELDVATSMQNNRAEEIQLLNQTISIYLVQGHCKDHIIYYFNNLNYLFVGDVIFNLGSGKIFEGTVEEALQSFELIKSFNDNIKVFCGHNYNKSNLAFTQSLGYFNINNLQVNILQNNQPTTLLFEKQFNPFLNITNVDFKKFFNKHEASNKEMYNHIRFLKANFVLSS